ncbi:hypothetical protein N2152v2_007772 [Parachlorella kessleri]
MDPEGGSDYMGEEGGNPEAVALAEQPWQRWWQGEGAPPDEDYSGGREERAPAETAETSGGEVAWGMAPGQQQDWYPGDQLLQDQQHEGQQQLQQLGGPEGAAPGGAGDPQQQEVSPAQYLQYLEGEIQQLRGYKAQLERHMAQAATAAYQQVSGRLGEAGTGVPVPADVPSLVGELAVLHTARQYLQYLQDLEALTRHAERAVAAVQQHGAEHAGCAQAASDAVEALSAALSYIAAVQQLVVGELAPSARVAAHAERLSSRLTQAEGSLHGLLSECIQSSLAQCAWPPPLKLSSSGGGGKAAAAAAAAGGAAAAGWRGFEGPGAAASVGALRKLLVVLLTLQRAVQHEAFQALVESGGEPPLLWAAEALARGLAARLRHHFAEGLPTDRPDKPEWLFAAAAKAVQASAPAVAVFQPCIAAHGLEAWYDMQLELARAVQALGVNAILREHVLPMLAAATSAEGADLATTAPLWLHLADEAMLFEKRFAPLRGHLVSMADDDDVITVAHPDSCIELLFDNPDWRGAWLAAEEWDAVRQLDAACDALNAWQPAQVVLGLPHDSDLLELDTPRARDTVASRHEFWPPAAAEQVVAQTSGLVRRCGWVAGAANRRAFLQVYTLQAQAVPLGVLRSFRERLGRQLAVAEGYRDMLSETWLPRVASAICAAHYVEHQLRDPQGVALLLELQDASSPAASTAPSITNGRLSAPADSHHPPDQQQGRQIKAGTAALLEREAAAYGALRRQWAYKLAKQAVDRFHELFAPYKADLSIFTEGFDDGGGSGAGSPGGAAAAGPHGADAGLAPSVSPLMLVAADKMVQMLNLLSQVPTWLQHLDSVVFRDVWKAVALAVNYALFNELATEALFSTQGTRQLDADVTALAAVFAHYTSRPGAHFKETKEACRLLLLPRQEAAAVLTALQRQPGAAKEVLRPRGIKLLNADQAATVLGQRLDLLTGRQ